MTMTLRLGVGASLTCPRRYIHPSRHIRERYVDPEKGARLENLAAVREEAKFVNRQGHKVIVMAHVGYPGIELYAVKRFCKVIAEGLKGSLGGFSRAVRGGLRTAELTKLDEPSKHLLRQMMTIIQTQRMNHYQDRKMMISWGCGVVAMEVSKRMMHLGTLWLASTCFLDPTTKHPTTLVSFFHERFLEGYSSCNYQCESS
eukprot:scaffold20461_cov117-Cylindrotheca_fusiformis.AAC.22